MFGAYTERLTSKVDSDKVYDGRPDQDQSCGHPAPVDRYQAPGHAGDKVPVRLHHVVDDHEEHGQSGAECSLFDAASPLLRPGHPHRDAPRVHDPRQPAHDAHERGGHADGAADVHADLYVAETRAVPPARGIVIGPDYGVDEAHDVQEHDPEDQAGGGGVLVAEVPDERGEVDGDCDRRENG